jgi:hypothetical protein
MPLTSISYEKLGLSDGPIVVEAKTHFMSRFISSSPYATLSDMVAMFGEPLCPTKNIFYMS